MDTAVSYFKGKGVKIKFVKSGNKQEFDDKTTNEIKVDKCGMLTGESCQEIWGNAGLLEGFVDCVAAKGKKDKAVIKDKTVKKYKIIVQNLRFAIELFHSKTIPTPQQIQSMQEKMEYVVKKYYKWYQFAPDYFHFMLKHSNMFFSNIPPFYFQNQGVEHMLHVIAEDVKNHRCPAHNDDDMMLYCMMKTLRIFTMSVEEDKFNEVFPELKEISSCRKSVLAALHKIPQATDMSTITSQQILQTNPQTTTEITQQTAQTSAPSTLTTQQPPGTLSF